MRRCLLCSPTINFKTSLLCSICSRYSDTASQWQVWGLNHNCPIFSLRLSGMGYKTISKKFKDKGWCTYLKMVTLCFGAVLLRVKDNFTVLGGPWMGQCTTQSLMGISFPQPEHWRWVPWWQRRLVTLAWNTDLQNVQMFVGVCGNW